ncbi:MAG: protein tyrosine phosphatase family protein [Pseudomonadota bacterium]
MAWPRNTLRTLLGFLGAVIKRRTPLGGGEAPLEDIYNYVPIAGLYATSGQPNERELETIAAAGVTRVVNLAPSSVLENTVIQEREILDGLGVEYVHIPVDFKNPTESDFADFVANVEDRDAATLWVHCAANMRVSAFTYRYRRERLGVDAATARADLARVWEPFGVWKSFLARAAESRDDN